jgi:catechol 2,3-dioxygenase-like lactoylglutathione lyase family enzyme
MEAAIVLEMRLDNLGVVTENLDASLDFYVRLLGFEEVSHDQERGEASVRLAGTVLYLLAGNGGPGPERSPDPAANPAGVDHISFAVTDVDEAYRSLSARGVGFFLPPQDADWGARVCGCLDPAGVPIYFLRWAVSGEHAP